jgi:hypothetical protein
MWARLAPARPQRPNDNRGENMIGFYVSVINGKRRALLLGPYPSHDAALADVDLGRKLAERVDPMAGFFAFGTARVENPTLPVGKLESLRGEE